MSKWRTIFTDTEGETGVAPVCDDHDDADVLDCCPHPHIETYSERVARRVARDLSSADAEPCS